MFSLASRLRFACIACLFAPSYNAHAAQASDNNAAGGYIVRVGLNHRVIIPQIIYFRVGSPIFDSVDKVTIDLNQATEFTAGTNTYDGVNPLGSSTPVAATNNGDIPIDLRSNVGTVTLSYQVSNPLGLANGSGQFIDYDEITTISDNAQLTPPILDNAATDTSLVIGNQFAGRVVNMQAVWTYSYDNSQAVVAGTYQGRVTYTASAP